jgi:hypothetical protein
VAGDGAREALAVRARVLDLDAAHYQPHPLHSSERAWPESNCYADLWIEVLHSLGLDPVAGLAYTLSLDFEGDQWLFFKPPASDLQALYSLDVHELNLWRTPLANVTEQVARGRLVLLELDSFYLPDTRGVSYRTQHTKTTVGITDIDSDARRMSYFHNAGYFAVEGEDFDQHFPQDPLAFGGAARPTYAEFVKIDGHRRLPDAELAAGALAQARFHLARRPRTNPVARFAARFADDLRWLRTEKDQNLFYQYAFATLRQCGACYELGGTFLHWLAVRGYGGLADAARELERLAQGAKTLQFKSARAVLVGKDFDPTPVLAEMQTAWDRAMSLAATLLAPQ